METLPRILILTGILFMGCLTGCTNRSGSAQSTERIAPLLEGMGGFHYPVNTNDTLAQAYFDQGLVLSYGFNHRESHRSFAQAALLDSNLAMAYWGQALVLGPNINAAMNPDDAPEAWRKTQQAVKIEDRLNYNEPPDWFFPVRHSLGAILLEAGEAEKAEQVYRKDLEKFPKNGWSLYGLSHSLKAQGKKGKLLKSRKCFDDAWQHADIMLSSSRIMENKTL